MTPPRDQQSELWHYQCPICQRVSSYPPPPIGPGKTSCYNGHITPAEMKRVFVTEHEEAREHLGNLLAIIHGDGGHYQAEHGDQKATTDAIAKYYELSTKHDEALPGDWTVNPHDAGCIMAADGTVVGLGCNPETTAHIIAAHNSALRGLVDALRLTRHNLDNPMSHGQLIREHIDPALQPYSGQKP